MIEVQKTPFRDLLVIKPKVFGDARGSFMESYSEKDWAAVGVHCKFVQDNQSTSAYGVLRGLHFQKGPYAQTKALRVVQGHILDVVIDLRPDSATFKKSFSIELSDKNGLQIIVPGAFAHGFMVLSETATVLYKCDNYYSPQHEGGIYALDPDLKIDWPVPRDKILLSDKDKKLPPLKTVIETHAWELK